MNKLLIISVFIFFKSFGQQSDCHENLKFKEIFFCHIKYVENNINLSQDSTFRKSVIFVSNYAPVSLGKIMNYARTYPIGVFEEDLKNWLKWYEENKCKNIQLKKTYVIPEVYQTR